MVNPDMDSRVERAVAAFNDHDTDRLMAQMTDDCTFTDPLEEDISGTELRKYTEEIFETFPDVRLEVDRVIESDDGVTALEGRYVGTHDAPMDDLPATGKTVSIPTMTVIDVSDDGITSWRDYWDQQAFTEQLGLGFPGIIPLVPRIALRKVKTAV